jgi:hypothetical protein
VAKTHLLTLVETTEREMGRPLALREGNWIKSMLGGSEPLAKAKGPWEGKT